MRSIFLSVAVCFAVSIAYAQDQDGTATQLTTTVLPMAPNAAALAKHVDVPVTYYTGTPQIDIPIYGISNGSLSMPVSLSYHASGIRVDEDASWVGLGWSLQAGGSISRSVRGLPDEGSNGFLSSIGAQVTQPNPSGDYLYKVSQGKLDAESDTYFLSAPGLSAKFYFNYDGTILLQDYTNVQITPTFTAQGTWKVIGGDGVQYFFGTFTNSGQTSGATETTTLQTDQGTSSNFSAWHLQSMISADKQDTIVFYYNYNESISKSSFTQESWKSSYIDNPLPGQYYCFDGDTYTERAENDLNMNQFLLSSIKYKEGSVDFTPSAQLRQDIYNANSLGQISIKDAKGNIVKYFGLGYGYFGNATDGNQKLKLTSVTEYAPDGSHLPPYQLQYNESILLPATNSLSIDHWGFYNSNNAATLIPQYIYKLDGTYLYYASGGNRDTDSLRTLANILTSITYPTGGRTQFDFEAHDIGKVGKFSAKEYYYETVTAGCNYIVDPVNPALGGCATPTNQFTITENTSVQVTISYTCMGGNETAGASATFSGPGDVNLGGSCGGDPSIPNVNITYNRTLIPGTYQLSTSAESISGGGAKSAASVSVQIAKQRDVSDSLPTKVGGARIKRIRHWNDNNTLIKTTKYEYTHLDEGTHEFQSTGVLVKQPQYYYANNLIKLIVPDGNTQDGSFSVTCTYNNAVSDSRVAPGEGTHIGYSEVREIQGESGENGYTIYKFVAADQAPDAGGTQFPFPPADSRANRRGKLLAQIDFTATNDTLHYLRNQYFIDHTNYYNYAYCLKVGQYTFLNSLDPMVPSLFSAVTYSNSQEWSYLQSTTEKNYNNNLVALKTTNYFYSRPQNHALLTSTQVSQSDGSIIKTRNKYPQDYLTGGTGLANINTLVTQHIYNPPVEVQVWNVNGTDSTLMSGKISDFNNQYYKPSNIWLMESSSPVKTLANETMSGGQYTTLISDNTLYQPRAQFSYLNGRIVAQSKTSDVVHAYIWGYNNLHPIAEAVNADQNSIAYTSFEDNSNGNWTMNAARSSNHFSGTQSYSMASGNISKTGLASNTYKVTFWAMSGASILVNSAAATAGITINGWTYYEITTTAVTSVTISGTGVIDDLRLYPSTATMKTYTYDPMRGVTSISDENNIPSFYEYDSFNRLYRLIDYKGNALKQFDYGYYKSNNGQ